MVAIQEYKSRIASYLPIRLRLITDPSDHRGKIARGGSMCRYDGSHVPRAAAAASNSGSSKYELNPGCI